MPKKKAANLTDEERILLEEQKQIAEQEMKKKKEDLLNQFLKDKIGKEEKFSAFNLNKLNQQWRNIMRELKSKELKLDIEILSQTFERVVDRKDAVIRSLANDLLEAEEQYSMAFRHHLENIDNLIDVETDQKKLKSDEYSKYLEDIKEEFESERNSMLELHQKEMNEISDVLFAMETNFTECETDLRSEYQSTRDELKNKNLEDKHALRVALEMKVDDLWNQFKMALQNYTDATEERKVAFETLKNRDENSSKEIDTQMKKLQKLSEQIGQMRSKMAKHVRESDSCNKKIKEEKEYMQLLFQDLKAHMNKLHDHEQQKLKKMTLESNAAIKELKRQKQMMELVLKQAEMARKKETEEEKVLPFFATSLKPSEINDIQEALLEPPAEPLASVMLNYQPIENFWKRYNKVLLEKLALDKEKSLLTEENQELRILLKQYLDGISVNEEVISQVNPLFVVNNKSNLRKPVPVRDPRVAPVVHNKIEAAHIVKYIMK